MYYLTKTFEIPIAHRLSKHKGRCSMFHGHNLQLEVTIKSLNLNENDMVMDFSDLKKIVNNIIDSWDHGMFINKSDVNHIPPNCETFHAFDSDPTSEILCFWLYQNLQRHFKANYPFINVASIAIWETSTSKSMYRED
jgi:6-pyruvoyltetrahydropterin/6-carboxytetrahydropterin synthase